MYKIEMNWLYWLTFYRVYYSLVLSAQLLVAYTASTKFCGWWISLQCIYGVCRVKLVRTDVWNVPWFHNLCNCRYSCM